MSSNPYRPKILFKEIFSWTYLRVLFRAAWLFFPSIIFLLLAWFAFWNITQGKDVMQRTLENKRIFYTFIIAQVFWVYIAWYTSRIIAKIKYGALPDEPSKEDHFWGRFLVQTPRFLAFSSLTIIILAFTRLKVDPADKFSWLFYLLLVASIFYYFGMYQFWSNKADTVDKFPDADAQKKYLVNYVKVTATILLLFMLVMIFIPTILFLIIFLVAIQAGLVLLLVFRRKLIYVENPEKKNTQMPVNLMARIKEYTSDKEDKIYTRGFIIILLLGLFFYITTIFSIRFSVYIGTFPFVLFAFGILLILGNGISILSVLKRINVHLLLIVLAFIIGALFEPHNTYLPEKHNKEILYSKRQTISEYFKHWIEERESLLSDTMITKDYPVYFVLSDGGASRSGYWVASVLAKLNEETNGEFNKHLFCLSGASGGSVGNAAYFNLLRAKQISDTIIHDKIAVQDYLETDFLTFTLARMLGPDVFRYVLPLNFIDDRAAALSRVLEKGSGNRSLLYNSMATTFSSLITQKDQPYSLPVLCINTTRMQDGKPAVISNIELSDRQFNERLDFLNLLGEKNDIKLSSAVVLGASFPYVSPAGRIDSACVPNYFVDGGYFDNSGSGVVSEMINILTKDSLYIKHKDKLKFCILHIANSPEGDPELKNVNPLINDLAAPVKTLIGAYGTQTTVNDERLKNQMISLYNSDQYYKKINLYDDGKQLSYSMNWVISDTMLRAMNESLDFNKILKDLVKDINKK